MTDLGTFIIILTISACLYFVFFNLINRRNTNSLLFSLDSIAAGGLFFIILCMYNNLGITDADMLGRLFFALLIISCQISLIIAQTFPSWEKRPGLSLMILLQIPAVLLVCSAFFIKDINKIQFIYNISFADIYYACAGIYGAAAYLTFLYKTIRTKNAYFKHQVLPGHAGIIAGALLFVSVYILLPMYFNVVIQYKNLGLLGILIIQLIANYMLSDEIKINFNKFFFSSIFRSVYIVLLFILSFLFFTQAPKIISSELFLFSAAAAFPVFLIILNSLLSPVKKAVINKKDKSLLNTFTMISNNISGLSEMRKHKMNWNNFFQKGIDLVCEYLTIEKASFFLLNKESNNFELVHSYNENNRSPESKASETEDSETKVPLPKISELNEYSEIIISLKKNKDIIEKSLLYTDKRFKDYKDGLIKFFNANNISTAIPAISNSGDLIGFLLFGKINKRYSPGFIAYLKNYGKQFSSILENLIISEEIRGIQAVKRDKMVVRNIKKRIIPVSIEEAKTLKVCSLFINNSDFGGDYFDSVRTSGRIGIYLSNTSDTGIESSMLALQMNSVFHSQAELHETPEGLLNIINQVLCTSRFTERYATALYIMYNEAKREIAFSNAAYNPLVIFDPANESFAEFDAEGIPAGIDIGFHYKSRTLSLSPGSIGFCFSNGLPSAFNKDGNNYPAGRIRDIIKINRNDTPAGLIKKIYNDLTSFIQNEKLLNDITLIVFKTI